MSLSRKTTTKLSHKPTIKKVRDKCLLELSRVGISAYSGSLMNYKETIPLPEKWEGEAVVGSSLTGEYPTIRLPDDCNHLVGKKVVVSLEVAE